MKYLDLQNRYQAIQEGKKKFMADEISYIKNALVANGEIEDTRLDTIHLNSLEQDYPEVVKVDNTPIRIKKLYLENDDIKFVGIRGNKNECSVHHFFLDMMDMEHIETAAGFVNRMMVLQGETNMYSLLVVYAYDNPKKINPVVLQNMTDEQIWHELNQLPKNCRQIYQLKGRMQKFPEMTEFIQDFNENSFWRHYAVNIMLKEKFL